MKVYISPSFRDKPDRADGGIRRVVEALHKHLPEFGIEVVDNVEDADLINCHAGDLINYPSDKPMVASCHGLYWSNYQWPDDHYYANQRVIEVMARAQAVTAPSHWVAEALRRGILKDIHVIHHGVDVEEWQSGVKQGYVLWNKARADVISNPADMQKLAALLPEVRFVSTLGQLTDNVEIVGPQPYSEMKGLIQEASVYLCTARETFGIGTLEALASGTEVVGWAFGGQVEIAEQGGCLLVPYGDYEALADAIRKVLSDISVSYSKGCQEVARNSWQWRDKIAQYATLFKMVYAEWEVYCPKVSIIVTSYNLEKYLDDCLASILILEHDYECIVIDDCSEDRSLSIAETYSEHYEQFHSYQTPQNLSLSGARNYGFSKSIGKYIIYLDGDDRLTPNGLDDLITSLDNDQSIHIAYGNLIMMSEDGNQYRQEVSPSNDFDWLAQMAHINGPFYCAMMRRQVLEQTGGYRVRDWRAEDASFWCRATSFGFRAKKVTDQPTIFYRLRPNGKGATERNKHPDGDGDWTAWYGWRLASTYQDGQNVMATKQIPNPNLVPYGAQTLPPLHIKTWNTNHYQEPLISIIIPVGLDHSKYLVDTLDSLMAQTVSDWEAIVINNQEDELELPGHPWAKIVNAREKFDAGYARNQGLKAAKGDLVLFLDADDWLLSNALHDMLTAYVELEGERYIYTNYISTDKAGNVHHEKLKDYDQHNWRGQHAVTVLMSRHDAGVVGGFDEDMKGWEDWDFAIKCQVMGICGHHVPIETFVYRAYSGQRRDIAATGMDELLPVLKERYDKYFRGGQEKKMCSCNDGGKAILAAKKSLSMFSAKINDIQQQNKNGGSGMTRMKFIGSMPGSKDFIRVNGQTLSKTYRGGNNSVGRYANVESVDIEALKSTGLWELVEQPTEAGPGQNIPPPTEINYQKPIVPTNYRDVTMPYSATGGAIAEAEKLGVTITNITPGSGDKITVYDVRRHAKELG